MASVTPLNRFEGSNRDQTTQEERHKRMAALLASTAGGDRQAFRELYGLSSRLIYGVVLAVMSDREIAAEVAQDVYLAIWRRAAAFDPERGNPVSWMAAIARNRAIDRLRAERTRGFVSFEADVPDVADTTDTENVAIANIAVRRLLADLRPEYRRALLLAYFKGYTHSELAAVMKVPVGTAKSWVRRGLEAMKEALE